MHFHPLWMDTMLAMPAVASQSSALPCCDLSHPTDTQSGMVKAIPSVIDVSPNQEHLVDVLQEKKRRNGAKM